jgi:hypothetical protein
MSERITEQGLAKTLIDSLAVDAPSDHARRAAARALGLAVPPVPAAATATAATAVKLGGLALVIGTAIAVTAIATRTSHVATPAPPGVTATSPTPHVEPTVIAVPAPLPAPVAPSPAPPRPRAPHAAAIEPRPRVVDREHTATPAAPADDALSTLAGETARLDAVRAALHDHAGARALELLDAYGREFPHGVLAVEATALEIDALFLAGKRDAATALGEEFLRLHPDSALVNRIRGRLANESRDQNAGSGH